MKKRALSSALSIILTVAMLIIPMSVLAVTDNGLHMEGASIRITGVQGLRFVGNLEKDRYDLTHGQNANYGIIMIPKSLVGEGDEITVETPDIRMVPAVNLMESTDTAYRFNAVLTQIPTNYYGTELIARAYVFANGTYYYSEQISRSVKMVADLIMESDTATEAEREVATEILSAFDEVGNDILVNAEDIFGANTNAFKLTEDFSLAPNEYYVKVENQQTILAVYNQKISKAVNGVTALWQSNKANLEDGFFKKESFALDTVSYSALTSSDSKLCVYGGAAKDPLTYTSNDEIVFRLACYSGSKLVSVPYIKYEIYNDTTGKTTTGYADASTGVATVTVAATGKTGVVYIDAYACNSSKSKITTNVATIDDYHFRSSAVVNLSEIRSLVTTPADFDSFWATQVENLYATPIEILKMVEKSSTQGGFKLFYVELKCNVYSGETDGIVSGYLTYPINASASSKIDLRVAFKGYSFSASEPSYKEGTATFSVCAHSIDCERANSDSSYLSQQESKNTIFNNSTNADKETAYFRGMILRDLQAARFMVEYFGSKGIGDGVGKNMWNGEKFTSTGASQGAFQAIAVAALDKNITLLDASIPWMCDVIGSNGTSNRRKSTFIMTYQTGLAYYDTTSFAHLITCETVVNASMGDGICPMAGVVAFYNALTCEKTLIGAENCSHSAWLQSTDYTIHN